MKFKRLRIRNYRGVEESGVEFADSGITVIQGPNEVGKTSLAGSINMLFNFKATANTKETRSIRPVHRDANPEVELEMESGGYHIRYGKVFSPRSGSTTLEIFSPRPGNFTADAAHEKVNQILRDTLDKELWDALIIQQGDMIEIPRLSGKAALMTALEASSGGGTTDAASESLFELVAREYAVYYNKNGGEKENLLEAGTALGQAEEREREYAGELRDLEKKAERCAALRKLQAELRDRLSRSDAQRQSYRTLAVEIEALSRRVEEERLAHKSAESEERAAAFALEKRTALAATLAEAAREAAAGAEALAEALPDASLGDDRLRERQDDLNRAEAAFRLAGADLARARADFDYLNDRLHLELMRERKARVDAARLQAREAEAELAATRISEQALADIKNADLEATRASARLEAEAPRLTLRGLDDCRLEKDGEPFALSSDEEREFPVTGALRLVVPGRVEMTVSAGGNSEALAARADQARDRLAALCLEAGVADLAEAFAALERRGGAERALRRQREVEKADLRDLRYDELCRRIGDLEKRTGEYLSGRPECSPPPEDPDRADGVRAEAEAGYRAAQEAVQAARARHAAAREESEASSSRRRDLAVRKELLDERLRQIRSELAAAREIVSDDALSGAAERARAALAGAEERLSAAEAGLEAKNPGRIRAMLETLTGSVETLEKQLFDTREEFIALESELRTRGEEGLFGKLQAARVDVAAKRLARERLLAAATAARLLYETMNEARDRAREAYLVPLKRKIEELGRWVFDPTFSVEMDREDLSISTRTLRGATVPFESLSGGTREQLSMLFRAACCILVSSHEGMPLILDDALGYTDNERLQLMGAVLAKAAEQCQIIIFTCVPERYGTIGEARVVQL